MHHLHVLGNPLCLHLARITPQYPNLIKLPLIPHSLLCLTNNTINPQPTYVITPNNCFQCTCNALTTIPLSMHSALNKCLKNGNMDKIKNVPLLSPHFSVNISFPYNFFSPFLHSIFFISTHLQIRAVPRVLRALGII